MSDIKIQYLFKHKKDGDFQSETLTLEEIEAKDFEDYFRVWKMDGYELVARRRFTGLRDKYGVNELYFGDIVKCNDGKEVITEVEHVEDLGIGAYIRCPGSGYYTLNPSVIKDYGVEVIGNIWEAKK